VAFHLLPRGEKFYTEFTALADQLVKGAAQLAHMLASEPPDWEVARDIRTIEQGCDNIAHEIFQRLNSTFVTPIDREDIHALATSLDDVMDAIDAAATVIRRYHVAPVRFGARELAQVIAQSTAAVRKAVDALEGRKGVHELAVEVNRLENEADRLLKELIAALFADVTDPIEVIKWKEIYETLEEVTDRCEDVVNVIEGIMLKMG
jgi:predicted phosphate transport protein (TIGR00153 family)